MTDDIVTRIREQANAGYIDEHEVMLRIAADEIERLRKIMTDFATAEREYQDAREDLEIVYFKEEWKKAWKAFTEEVEKYDR